MPVADIADVVSFWTQAGQERWFGKDAAFDDRFRDLFLDTHLAAARRELDHWADTAEGALALMILLDQFPRNCFRGTGHMYATDPLALSFARRAVDAGLDHAVAEDLRVFFYLPFMHSEDVADQGTSVLKCRSLNEATVKAAHEHRDIVERFGRFPHRNPMLGRDTTTEEKDFLSEGGFAG
ncbi:MAG: DUF924 family protein [Rhizobiaceae bacterium]|nr:DUF924 family protein [Rhizobiaceae bacterium]